MAKNKKVKKTTTTVVEEIINVKEKTQMVCILDTSGSMSSIIEEARGGFNEFIKKQKELPDEATITVALFDSEYELIYDNIDIKNAEELTSAVWYPRGMTALNDAIGKTINDVKATHAKMKKKDVPDKVIVCIVTDGQENNSREYATEDVKKLIAKCEKDNWTFIFLAADQDAFAASRGYGIKAGNTMNYMKTSKGNEAMFSTVTASVGNMRGASLSDVNYKSQMDNLVINNEVKESDIDDED
jgi:von Willebrand factor type A domain